MATDKNKSIPAADKYRLADLVDLPLIQKMVDAHYRAAGMPMGIIDALDGSILVGAGWQEICVKFHRANPASRRRCEESDNYMKDHLAKGKTCAYKCANGLWDIGIPIIVADRHLATMFLGQFFYEGEAPDREFFKRQAREFGYATDDYLAALDKIPAFNREKVEYILAYNNALAGFISDIAEHATERKRIEKERLANLRFLESIDRVNRAVQGTDNPEKIMSDVLETMLSIFGSDRAWLLYPCDPGAPSWRVPMERTRPEYPGAQKTGIEVPLDPDIADIFRTMLAADGPVTFGRGAKLPMMEEITKRFQVQSQIVMTLYPGVDKPWLLGMHQCSYPRAWTKEEENIFQEIGRRLGFVLTNLLMFRNLRESETKYRRIVDTANEGIWMIGEDLKTTFVNKRMAELIGYRAEEMAGLPMADFMFEEDRPEHFKTIENRRRGISENYERRLRRKDGQPVWAMVSASPVFDDGNHFKGSFAMFTDITERKHIQEELQNSYAKLQRSFGGIINAITMIVETRDPYTAGHQRRVSLLAAAIAKELGISDEMTHNISVGAALHDIGKIYVPAEILSKPTAISPLERDIIRLHPQGGYDILKNIEFPSSVAQIALQHQERIDGSGYPRGLSGNDILFEVKIVSVADVVEAMTFNRPYRGAIGKEKALAEIVKGKGILYEPAAVDACIKLFQENNFSFKE